MPVTRWITEWVWEKTWGRKGETIIVLDEERDDLLVGYGTWKHREDTGSVLKPLQIGIAWFGIHSDYQGMPFDDENTVADVVYAEVERFAREHDDSTPDMQLTLTCHTENERALKFYRKPKTGFRLVGEPNPQVEDNTYYRLVR